MDKLDRNLANQTALVSEKGGFGYQLKLSDLKGRRIEKDLQFDIFVFRQRADGNYTIQGGGWEESYYKNKEEVLPAVDCKMWDIVTKCPRLSTMLVKREYVFFLLIVSLTTPK